MRLLTRMASAVSQRLGTNSTVVTTLRPVYESLMSLASAGRGVEWPINGEEFRVDPRARRFVAPTGEPELWGWLRANVRSGERVLDVGSFLGVYAIFIARWAGPGSKVLAFEPTPGIASVLTRHVMMNGVQDRVEVLSIALGEEPGEVEIHEHSEPYRNAIGITDPAGEATRRTPVVASTIDAVCKLKEFEPSLIRMDVQGAEAAVLKGARNTIAQGRDRLRMVLEVHPQLWPLYGIDPTEFDGVLGELGLRARPLHPRSAVGYQPDEHVELEYI